jgi:CubicO group peptidase (beta-lactamase class C family)
MLRHFLAFPVLCLAMAASAATMPIDARPVDTRTATRIDADVETILQRAGTPGATILIAKHGHTIYRHAYGLGDRGENRRPATVDTEYEIGSITKQFTAAAILQLQEAGKLHLDDKVSTYLPNAPYAAEVTFAQIRRRAGQDWKNRESFIRMTCERQALGRRP